MKLGLFLVGLMAVTIPCCAQRERISSMLNSMEHGGPVPSEKVFRATVDENYVKSLPSDLVEQFLRPAGRLLSDPRPEARQYALTCFLPVVLRPSRDSEALLEPHVPALLMILNNRADPLREMAKGILSYSQPRISSKTIEYLKAHLADQENDTRDTGWMAWMLLDTRNDTLAQDVIAFVRKQDNPEVIAEVLRCIRVRQIPRTADVLSLISYGLDSPAEWTRRRAVEAVATLPFVERSPFLAQLKRLATDPKETPENRSAAANVLKK
ncbi:MAG: hypothetical protein J0H49_28455 [Acidobacteria bacterium]|nr:hypothetical protein [Acidobacteriota bacterium]